jgi:hypothetical protein
MMPVKFLLATIRDPWYNFYSRLNDEQKPPGFTSIAIRNRAPCSVVSLHTLRLL